MNCLAISKANGVASIISYFVLIDNRIIAKSNQIYLPLMADQLKALSSNRFGH